MCHKKILSLDQVYFAKRDKARHYQIDAVVLGALIPLLRDHAGDKYTQSIKKEIKEKINEHVKHLGQDVKFQSFDTDGMAYVEYKRIRNNEVKAIPFQIARVSHRSGEPSRIIENLAGLELRVQNALTIYDKLESKEQIDYRKMVTTWNHSLSTLKKISEEASELALNDLFSF